MSLRKQGLTGELLPLEEPGAELATTPESLNTQPGGSQQQELGGSREERPTPFYVRCQGTL